jgi:hypothetical protein
MLVLGGVAVAAFATLGDGRANKAKPRKLMSSKVSSRPGSFSLQSGYNFRGSQVINYQQTNKYINLNTVATYQSGHTTYTVPVTKKVILNNKITFNPNSATR